MAKDDTKTPKPAADKPARQGRNISFTLPTMPTMPRISWHNIAIRTKLIGFIAVLLIGLLGGYLGAELQDSTSDNILTGSLGDGEKIITEESHLISTIAKRVSASVVSVNVSVTGEASAYERYFGIEPYEQDGAGTGIIISKSGLILTNRHVVPAGTTNVSVTLSDGTELEDVKVVGRTAETDSLDIAILKIEDTEGKKLTPAVLGDSSQVAIGDEVVAIGNALGQFQNTITSGIISGYGRSIVAGSSSSDDVESLDNLFQTDAAINEGNSGGPLVNLNGQVIGVNTAVASDSQNIGFAIPINDVTGLVKRAVATGKFERPFLGVRYIALTADIAQQFGLTANNGAFIAPNEDGDGSPIVGGGAADKAGLKPGDIITRVDGQPVDKTNSLTSLLGRHQPGDKVSLTVVNGNSKRTVSVTLGAAPAN